MKWRNMLLPLRLCARPTSWIADRYASVVLAVLSASFLVWSPLVSAQTAWPTIALPDEVRVFPVSGQVTANGLPMQMNMFDSSSNVARLAAWFRKSMGKPLVENTMGNKLILGRAQGEYYLTVQLEAAGSGTRGTTAVTHVTQAVDNRADTKAAADRWLSRMPGGSRILNQTVSQDDGKIATHLVIVNTQSADVNRDRLTSLMEEDGLNIESETVADAKTAAALPYNLADGKTLFFKGQGKEAIAVIFQGRNNQTAIVVNTIHSLERIN